MTEFYESKIVAMIGTPNGVTTQFTTPTSFVAGSIRVIWNGVLYGPEDDEFGWTEVAVNKIQFSNRIPITGDVLNCFYQELDPVPGVSNVKGSPFSPDDSYP